MAFIDLFRNCGRCNKSGLFTKLNKEGYCAICAAQRKEERAARLEKEREEILKKIYRTPSGNSNIAEVSHEENDRKYSYIPRKYSNPTAYNSKIINLDYIKDCKERFIAFDLETTGFSPLTDRIIEISAVIFENLAPSKTFSTLVNPERRIPEAASNVNHIYDSDVAGAPIESDAIRAFCDFVGENALNGDVIFVAHNAQFDIKFLLHAFSRNGIEANLSFQDTLYLSRQANLNLDNNKLGTVATHFDISQEDAHRAADDARVCGEIFTHLLLQKEFAHNTKLGCLADSEIELCKWLKNIIQEADLNTQLLTFQAKTYLSFRCLYEVAKFKPKARIPYALVDRNVTIPDSLRTAETSKSEGEQFVRVLYQNPSDLAPIKQYFIDEYRKMFEKANLYIGDSEKRFQSVSTDLDTQICI